jgi:hypothetical protein
MNVEYHITHTAEMVHLVFPYAVRKGSTQLEEYVIWLKHHEQQCSNIYLL